MLPPLPIDSSDEIAVPEWAGPAGALSPSIPEDAAAAAERELAAAIREYQRRSGRLFPTWSEVLEVASALGYRRRGAIPPA